MFGAALLFVLALAIAAPAGASAKDWTSWDDMISDARKVPHTETRVCHGSTCTTTIVVTVDAKHKAITKRIIGPGVDKKLMCMVNKPCIPW